MNPLRILARNYRTFELLELDLPAGVAAITGANGAGKSSLVNVVDLALFGPEGRSWAPYLRQGAESTELELELVFEHGGQTYRIRRGYSGRGRGKATLDLEIQSPHKTEAVYIWDPLTRETIAQTETALEELLGLTRETFRASAFLAQGDGAAFTEAEPRERKRILANVLGLDRFERLLALVRRDRAEADREIAELTGAIEAGEAEAAGRAELERLAQAAWSFAEEKGAEIATAEAELAAARDEVASLLEYAGQRAARAANLTDAEARLRPLEEAFEQATAAYNETQIVKAERETLTTPAQRERLDQRHGEIQVELERYRTRAREIQDATKRRELAERQRAAIQAQEGDLRRKAADLRRRASELEAAEAPICDRCGQDVRGEHLKATIAGMLVEAEEQIAGADDLRIQAEAIEVPEIPAELEPPGELLVELSGLEQRLQKARQDELAQARLAERVRTLTAIFEKAPEPDELAAARAEALHAREALAEMPQPDGGTFERARERVQRVEAALTETRHLEARARDQAVEYRAKLDRLDEVAAALQTRYDRRGELQTDVDRYAILERAYGRDGIPAMIVSSSAIPSIEAEAARILAELGTSYRVELRTEKALAGGGTADALDVVVVTEEGERPYETFSGGERTRLNLALRIALARLLAHRRGAESRLLAIDEPEFLDEAGVFALAGVLDGLQADFERIYLISHVPDLRAAFDQVLEVRRNGTGSSELAG